MEEYVALKENETITLQSARLYDLGHALMPDRSASTAIRVINEALQYTMFLALAGVFAVPYWLPLLTDGRRDAKVYTVDMVTRFLVSLAIGHFLRMCCYLVTSLPGPAQHCIVDMNNKPKTVMDILTSPRVGGNCGDLIFSGHMLTVVTIFSIIQLYVECIFSRRTSLLVLLALSPLAFWQVLNILLLRAHYTVDMVVAVEVALFLNLTLHRLWWVSDHAVCEEGSVSGTPSDTNSESVIIHFDEEVVDEGRPVSESALPKVLVITSPDSNSESLSGQGETLECSQNDE
ncbi:hypothetical protein AGDE_16336 [Angomonas deanei]|uniref:PAP2 superfamily C-terminal, putative n=1 Tax=Angomonas deanei TaxID=59799 RepID=A0A7G2CXD9_9TRYP|nr:hypothetical protein AGDE_16336 [Angomonas deanei]CAD2222952.1 PAP2 superfamily C-terminal, putative [Angomonas deanei]|eukprot:EPY17288.1 hypothetical protein AGDE_16336 [Angomonas deanei]